jgi:hypothetical protein
MLGCCSLFKNVLCFLWRVNFYVLFSSVLSFKWLMFLFRISKETDPNCVRGLPVVTRFCHTGLPKYKHARSIAIHHRAHISI